MEYKDSTPVMHWFNSSSLAVAANMEWNKDIEYHVPHSEVESSKTATIEFDGLDCEDLKQLIVDSDYLSFSSYGDKQSSFNPPAADDSSLTTVWVFGCHL